MSLIATVKRLAASDGRALIWLLFLPGGWIGRINFLRGTALIFILTSLLLVVALRWLVRGTASPEQFAIAFLGPFLIALYPAVCVSGKRLHGLGLTAWVQMPLHLLMATGLILLALYQRPAHSDWMNNATALTLILGCLGETGMFVWLAAWPNQRELGSSPPPA